MNSADSKLDFSSTTIVDITLTAIASINFREAATYLRDRVSSKTYIKW